MATVVVGGIVYDPNIPSQQEALFGMGFEYVQGQWVQTGGFDAFVEAALTPPSPELAPGITSIGGTVLGVVQNVSPGVMQNVVSGGVWAGFDPNDMASGMAIAHAYSLSVYGSVDLGTVRYSSEVLENEPTGVRPGTMERIVIPAWARRERGSPL